MRLLLAVCLALAASGCAQTQTAVQPVNPVIEDLGWKSKTLVKTAEPHAPVTPVPAALAPKPAKSAAKSTAAKTAARTTATKAMVGAPVQKSPQPVAAKPAGHVGGTCGTLAKANCQGICTWVEVTAANKSGDQGYCTSARSF